MSLPPPGAVPMINLMVLVEPRGVQAATPVAAKTKAPRRVIAAVGHDVRDIDSNTLRIEGYYALVQAQLQRIHQAVQTQVDGTSRGSQARRCSPVSALKRAISIWAATPVGRSLSVIVARRSMASARNCST